MIRGHFNRTFQREAANHDCTLGKTSRRLTLGLVGNQEMLGGGGGGCAKHLSPIDDDSIGLTSILNHTPNEKSLSA